jgi:hypothetical protein
LPLVPIAAFLTGALLTILLPLALLIALGVWYWQVSARVPDTADGPQPGTAPPAANPAPGTSSETTRPAREA